MQIWHLGLFQKAGLHEKRGGGGGGDTGVSSTIAKFNLKHCP